MADIPSNLKQVYAMVNGQRVNATYDTATQLYTIETTAPAASSWSQPDHVYTVTLYAEDQAGNTASVGPADKTYGDQLKIRVLEKTKPTAIIKAPTQGSVLGTKETTVSLEMYDEGGSGLNMSSVVFKVNNTSYASALSWSDSGNKKVATYKATGLTDGSNTIVFSVQDNDGNASTQATVTFVVSTAAPSLEIKTPIEGLITNASPVTVTGTAKPGSSYVTISSVTVNGQNVNVGTTGEFSYDKALVEGANEIIIIATDSAGNSTTVRRNVTLDTKAPVISDVVAAALTVDASGTIKITFKVSET